MRVVVQRVKNATCHVNDKLTGECLNGFLLLVGFKCNDTLKEVSLLAKKVANMRIFTDENMKMNKSLKDVFGTILSISQFTLYADCKHGNRPSFTNAMPGNMAIELYKEFNNILRNEYNLHVEEGIFGADMKIQFLNDGPITIILDSEEL